MGAVPTRSARTTSPEAKRTASRPAPVTTWSLVTACPAASQMNPVPDCTPVPSFSIGIWPDSAGSPTTCTTEGETRSNTWMVVRSRSDSSPRASTGRGEVALNSSRSTYGCRAIAASRTAMRTRAAREKRLFTAFSGSTQGDRQSPAQSPVMCRLPTAQAGRGDYKSSPLYGQGLADCVGAALRDARHCHDQSTSPLLASHFWMSPATWSLFLSIMIMCELPFRPMSGRS